MTSVLMPLAGDLAQMDISMTLPRGFPDNDDNNAMMIHNGMTMTTLLIVNFFSIDDDADANMCNF